ncbi:hypothetical protein EJ110_NYTH03390 [Nymphaea thermarum]|nr:hypothetical protein EJ110_NYTH03390 [Nymphaea thermarum]
MPFHCAFGLMLSFQFRRSLGSPPSFAAAEQRQPPLSFRPHCHQPLLVGVGRLIAVTKRRSHGIRKSVSNLRC